MDKGHIKIFQSRIIKIPYFKEPPKNTCHFHLQNHEQYAFYLLLSVADEIT